MVNFQLSFDVLVDQINTNIEPAFRYHKIIVFYLQSRTCNITQKTGKFISLKCSNNEQVVGNLIDEFQRTYEIVKR